MKSFTALLAVALLLCLSLVASSSAQQDLRSPDQIGPTTAAQQDLRSPDQVTTTSAALQDLRSPDQIVPSAPAAPQPAAASTDALPTSDGGISTLWIVLICIGGALTLAAAGYTTTRVAHAHRHSAT
jgi:hypothetical protein